MFGVVPTKSQNSSNGHKILRTCTVHDNSKYNYMCGPYNASQIIVTKTCGNMTAKILTLLTLLHLCLYLLCLYVT